jgi:hypothetical protein
MQADGTNKHANTNLFVWFTEEPPAGEDSHMLQRETTFAHRSPRTHRHLPRYWLRSFGNKYWSHPHTPSGCSRNYTESGWDWRFLAVGTVSNSPYSYNIQGVTGCSGNGKKAFFPKNGAKGDLAGWPRGRVRTFDLPTIFLARQNMRWMRTAVGNIILKENRESDQNSSSGIRKTNCRQLQSTSL